MKSSLKLISLAGLMISLPVISADYYVDNVVGNDAFDGKSEKVAGDKSGPVATIDIALKKAVAGDTVHMNNTGKLYRQSADFYGMKGGEPGKAITFDGHGVTMSGAEVLAADGWKPYKDGIVMRDDMVGVFLIVDGKMVFLTLETDVLQPGEICYVPRLWNRLFYRPSPDKKPEIEVGQPDGSSVKLDPKAWQAAGMPNGIIRHRTASSFALASAA